ncbi:MAG TPA: M28 family metallopeptidase [Terriglobales bacterium]|nr:M28 family metallopeptidase [Terriglobales bacterium]
MRKSPVVLALALCMAASMSAQSEKAGAAKQISTSAKRTSAAAAVPAAANASLKLVDPQRIRAHVKFLSSDLLEGRGTGQRGGNLTVEYIATQLALNNVKPAGDRGTYLQKVPMVGLTTSPESKFSLIPVNGQPINLSFAKDITAYDETEQATSDIDAEIVFVGYGIDAPEYKWNDYKDVDVKGKVLLMLVNEPPSDDPSFFKGKALTYYGRWTYKFEEAARKGAAGALIVHKTDMASYGWNVVETSNTGEKSYLRNSGKPKLNMASWIQLAVADQIAKAAGKDINSLMEMAKSRDFRPIPMPIRMKAHIISKVRPFDSYNVLGVVPGSDPALKEQGILYSAHWDHLGIHPDQQGDNIYNGAVDNATGIGVLLEVARAFGENPVKPKRSIYFAAVTAEEQGLRGSEYLGLNPPIPAKNISLGLNFDGLAPIGVPEQVEVTGAERNTFYPTVQRTAKEFNLTIVPDDNPGAGYFYRSDHFSLSRVGVPAFSVNQGSKFEGKPKAYGEQFQNEYTKNDYHQPSDEFRDNWDFEGNAKMARFGVALGWKAANMAQVVQWQPGDEFEKARKDSQQVGR